MYLCCFDISIAVNNIDLVTMCTYKLFKLWRKICQINWNNAAPKKTTTKNKKRFCSSLWWFWQSEDFSHQQLHCYCARVDEMPKFWTRMFVCGHNRKNDWAVKQRPPGQRVATGLWGSVTATSQSASRLYDNSNMRKERRLTVHFVYFTCFAPATQQQQQNKSNMTKTVNSEACSDFGNHEPGLPAWGKQ